MKQLISSIKVGERIRDIDSGKVAELVKSIEIIGLTNPILLTMDNILIAGAHRLEACKQLGYTEIDCVFFEKDELHARLAEIDENFVRNDLDYITRGDLSVERDEILEEMGLRSTVKNNQYNKSAGAPGAPALLTTEELAKEVGIASRTLQEDKQISRNLAPEVKRIAKEIELPKKQATQLSKKPVAEQKRIIAELKSGESKTVKQVEAKIKQEERKEEVKSVKLENVFKGDAVTILKTLESNSIDCVLTDPPYGIDYKDTRETSNAAYKDGKEYALKLLEDVCKELKRVLKKDAHLYFFSSCSNLIEFKQILMKYFDVQFNPLIWVKNNHTMCDFQNKYASKYELIWFCHNGVEGDRKLNYKCSPDILNYDIPTGKEHSAQKPVELLKYLIGNSTVEKETVLDMFAGSGSVGIAAKELNRNFILIEVSEEHYNLILKKVGG